MTAIDLIGERNDDGISLSAPLIMELIEAVHEKGASFRFQARGYSMTPVIRDGDYITLSPLGETIPGRGDVLAFRHPDRPQMLVHRVLREKGKCYFCKGDNCSDADGWIPAENLLAIVTQVERAGKKRFWPNRSHPGFRSFIYLYIYPLGLPVRRWMAKSWRRVRAAIRSEN